MKTGWALALTPLLLAGCAGRHEAYCRYQGPARIGQTVYLRGPSLRPEQLLEDSRCPIDVKCVQAGTVRVRVTLIGEDANERLDMTLGRPINAAGGRLTLLSVQPQRRTTQSPAPEDYRLTFDFKAGDFKAGEKADDPATK